jgi:hypothetical protein
MKTTTQTTAPRYNDFADRGDYLFSHAGKSLQVFVLEDDQGIKCLHAYHEQGTPLVAEVFGDSSIEFAPAWERLAA